jgi:Na+/phosphate symporter
MGFWIALVVCIVGAVLYAFSANAKVQTLARDAFWVGLFIFLLELTGHLPAR